MNAAKKMIPIPYYYRKKLIVSNNGMFHYLLAQIGSFSSQTRMAHVLDNEKTGQADERIAAAKKTTTKENENMTKFIKDIINNTDKIDPPAADLAEGEQQQERSTAAQNSTSPSTYAAADVGGSVSDGCGQEERTIMWARTEEFIEKARMVHTKDEMQLATKAMWKYYKEKQISPAEMDRRKKLAKRLSDVIRRGTKNKMLKEHSLIVTGSSHTGCCTLQGSDLDMCMFVPRLESKNEGGAACSSSLKEYSRHNACDYLHDARRSLKRSLNTDLRVIDAIIPILRFRISSTGRMSPSSSSAVSSKASSTLMECDINFMSVVGVYNSYLIRAYSEWDARFPALLLNVKHLARMHGFNDASNNMLGSYSLTLMIIHFLQAGLNAPILPCMQKLNPDLFSARDNPADLLYHRPYPSNPDRSSSGTTGAPVDKGQLCLFELLIAFFNYYDVLDNQRFGVSVRLGGLFEMDRPFTQAAFFVEEPFVRNNAARAATKRRSIAEKIHWGSRISPPRVMDILQKS